MPLASDVDKAHIRLEGVPKEGRIDVPQNAGRRGTGYAFSRMAPRFGRGDQLRRVSCSPVRTTSESRRQARLFVAEPTGDARGPMLFGVQCPETASTGEEKHGGRHHRTLKMMPWTASMGFSKKPTPFSKGDLERRRIAARGCWPQKEHRRSIEVVYDIAVAKDACVHEGKPFSSSFSKGDR